MPSGRRFDSNAEEAADHHLHTWHSRDFLRYSSVSQNYRERTKWHLEDVVFHGVVQPSRHLHTLFSGRSEAQGAASLGRISRDELIARRARKT